jgi:NitT/TauT family transport system substrate-binding protein
MLHRFGLLALLGLLLGACGSPPVSNAPVAPAATSAPVVTTNATAAAATQPLRTVTVAMPFIPNVQFAPFYVAVNKGYYREAGIDVVFDYNYETDVVQRVAAGNVEFAMAAGNSVLLARANDLPVRTILTVNQRFPVVLFSKQAANITQPADLKGKTVGLPGRFGSSYVGLQALLYASDMTESDLNLQEIGFTQIAALSEDQVEVAIGYAMNEPVVLERQGTPVNVITIADYFPLASDGVIVNEALLESDPALVEGFARATLRGLRATLDAPDDAFAASLEFIPEAQSGDTELQRAVLQGSLPFWATATTERNGLGYSDPESWRQTYAFLRASNLLTRELNPEEGFTNQFISAEQ